MHTTISPIPKTTRYKTTEIHVLDGQRHFSMNFAASGLLWLASAMGFPVDSGFGSGLNLELGWSINLSPSALFGGNKIELVLVAAHPSAIQKMRPKAGVEHCFVQHFRCGLRDIETTTSHRTWLELRTAPSTVVMCPLRVSAQSAARKVWDTLAAQSFINTSSSVWSDTKPRILNAVRLSPAPLPY